MADSEYYYERKADKGKPAYGLLPLESLGLLVAPVFSELGAAISRRRYEDMVFAMVSLLEGLNQHEPGEAQLAQYAYMALQYGAEKYAPDSWRDVPDAKERYRHAAARHFVELACCKDGIEGLPDMVDIESGLPHLAHLAANVLFCAALDWEGV